MSRLLAASAVVLALLVGCSEQSGSPAGQAPKEATGAGDQVWIPGWRTTSVLSTSRAGAAAVVADGVLYVIGGVDGRNFLDTVEYARINADGSLSPWQSGPRLNAPRGFTAAAVYGRAIYVVGGGNGPNGKNLLNSVEWAPIRDDGSLGPWQTQSNGMVVPRRCSKVLIRDNVLYSFGGFGGAMLDTVEHSRIAPDGRLGRWVLEKNPMTILRYVNSVKLDGDISYAIGGHDQQGGKGVASVEWARIGADGHGQWQATSSLATGRYGLATAKHERFLYAIGGSSGTEYLDSIEMAAMGDQGLSPWRETTPLSVPRSNFSAVTANGRVYVIGGTNRDGYFSTVDFAGFNEQGEIGVWGTRAEQQAYQQAKAARKAYKAQLPNQGEVLEVIPTSGYSYVRVLNPVEGELWLAGNRIDELRPGVRIAYSTGVLMTNFYSKELKRAFPRVLFVGSIEIR